MRHLTAVHVDLPSGSGWHYATLGSKGGGPYGACSEHLPHATEDEARRCFRTWQRERVVKDDGQWSWASCGVTSPERCRNPANRAWRVEGDAYSLAMLCEEHDTREHAIVVMHLDGDVAGDSWQS